MTGVGLLGLRGEQADLLEIRPLAGRQADQVADPLVERAVGPGAEQVGHRGASNS